MVVGYNLPFDLARLAIRASGTRPRLYNKRGERRRPQYVDAWSLTLWLRSNGQEDRFRPRLRIKHIDRNRSLMAFSPVPKEAKVYPGPGSFLDLKTLVFALTDQGMSLARAGEVFEAPVRKSGLEEYGTVTPESLTYGRHDVRATASLLEVVRHELDRHPIETAPAQVKSPAALAKGYLSAMGVTAPLTRAKTIPPRRLGQGASAYFGGRAECRIRKVVVPVVTTDFTSMYPTVNILTRLQEYLTAERLSIRRCTSVARSTLAGITSGGLLSPDTWPDLRFIAEVVPDGDILPVRTTYDRQNPIPTIGVNPVYSRRPLWYTGFDLAASMLLNHGVPPKIRQAFRIVPSGQLGSLRPTQFRGEVSIDPRGQDIFQTVIERRHAVRHDATRPAAQREALQRGLKVYANSGSYGVMAEFTSMRLPGDAVEQVRVEHGSAPGFDARVRAPEIPGPFCFPPVAAFITGAARLILALAERMVEDLGGTYLAMDTDSIHIVASEDGGWIPCPGGPHLGPKGDPGIRALSWANVNSIVTKLDRLKPYGPQVTSPLLKIENENYAADDRRKRVQLYGLGLAAKRYVLFERAGKGRVVIRKRSDFGLGAYLDPTDPRPRAEGPDDPGPNDGWVAEAWRRLIHRALGRPEPRAAAWWSRPAVIQFTASSPDRLKPYLRLERPKPYVDRLKPFNFMLAADVRPDTARPESVSTDCAI